MGNIFDNLKQIGQLKQQAAQFEKILRSRTVEVSSPKGEIKLGVNGKMELTSIEINPDVLKPENKNYLEKLFKNTFASAQREIEKIISSEMKSQIGF
ncbi:MAG: YbaB/EbfC family nucleoid-associated protein [Candidatus Omnitrophica bacterium]|nr:YbaB/EbfC family nucleoid-associated protein [Candidatus Omnitrophota bacterium]